MEENELISINFKAFFKVLWKEKWWIILITLLVGGAGILYAFSIREEFVSEGKILPEVQSKAGGIGGQLSGLAALAGVDISGIGAMGTDAVRPDLYPDVLKSTPFFLELFKKQIKTRNGQNLIFSDYYAKNVLSKPPKPENLKLKFPTSDEYIALPFQTEQDLKNLRERITANYDKKTGIITVRTKFPDPVVAAQVARFSMDYLTEYIINYRTGKAKNDLQFIAEQLNAAKGKFYNNQAKKARYSDIMPLGAMKMQSADLQRERIESEYKTSSTFYNSLLQKYEEAKIRIQQETPVLKVLEPPVVPNTKSEPKKSIIIMASAFIGGILGVIFSLLYKRNYKLILG